MPRGMEIRVETEDTLEKTVYVREQTRLMYGDLGVCGLYEV